MHVRALALERKNLAKQWGCPFFETSAKMKVGAFASLPLLCPFAQVNVGTVFVELVRTITKNRQ